MKLLSYQVAGRESYGALIDDKIVDLSERLGQPTLRLAIASGMIDRAADVVAGAAPDHALSEVEMRVPVPDAPKIVCIGRNYRAHVAEGNAQLPATPSTFVRVHNSFVAPGAALVRPKLSEQFDYEGELALVIGKAGRHISRERAYDHIAGYTCMQEACVRNYQFEHCLTVGKNFTASGSIGPWMATADEIADAEQLTLTTTLNGAEVQHAKTDNLIFDIPAIIAYLSGIMELTPGDIIATGTPEGVGFVRKPPLWLKPGDEIDVAITGIGVLHNTVVAE